MLRSLVELFHRELEPDRALKLARRIHAADLPCTFTGFHESARICLGELERMGLDDARLIPIRCDGTRRAWDVVMPRAWDVRAATLDLVEPKSLACRLADYADDPRHLALFSAPTPRQGIEAEVVLEEECFRKDCRGKIILHSSEREPSCSRGILEKTGAIGGVSDWSPAADELPDGVVWNNSYTNGSGWYTTREEKPAFGFSISPARGRWLRKVMAAQGRVKLRAVVRSRLYSGRADTVSGLLRGSEEPEKEVLVLAHLYEPFLSDNATGVAASVEIARTLLRLIRAGRLPAPRRSIRFLFSWELYGFMDYLKRREKQLPNMLAAVNLDGIALAQKWSKAPMVIFLNPATQPVFQDAVFEDASRRSIRRYTPSLRREVAHGEMGDDLFMAEPSLGIPSHWLYSCEGRAHHNSLNTFARLDPKAYRMIMSVSAAHAHFLAHAGSGDLPRLFRLARPYFERKVLQGSREYFEKLLAGKPSPVGGPAKWARAERTFLRCACASEIKSISRHFASDLGRVRPQWRSFKVSLSAATAREIERVPLHAARRVDVRSGNQPSIDRIAENMIPRRRFRGLLMDLPCVPLAERKRCTEYRFVLSFMDGKRDLLSLACMAALAQRKPLDANALRSLVSFTRLLEKYRYLEVRHRVTVTQDQFAAALEELGIPKDGILFVHSALSALGEVQGGAEMILRALRRRLGRTGTLLLPTFSPDANVIHTGLRKLSGMRVPYDMDDLKSNVPETGLLAVTFLRQPNVWRSAHPTHSVAAWGKEAALWVAGHDETCAPCGKESVFERIFREGDRACLMFLGCEPSVMTFLHFFEDRLNLPYLPTGRLLIRKGGRVQETRVRRYPDGPRDFYNWAASKIANRLSDCKMAGRRKLRLGLGTVQVFPVLALSLALLEIFAEEPDILIPDSRSPFCVEARRKIRAGQPEIAKRIAALQSRLAAGV